jgi:hypothetical protein
MRTKNFLKHLILGAMLLATGMVVGQSTTPGNVAGAGTDFLGWNTNAANNFPLVVKHELNQPIEFYTDNALRMRLTQTLTAQIVNGYTNRNLSGHLGVGLFTTGLVNRPFTLLHLDSAGTQDSGYRPWMKVGMALTRESDLSYFGLKPEGNDRNHAVIAWSDNTPGVHGPDLLKFIFLRNNVGSTTAASLNGLEAARFLPDVSGNQSFFGVGDWFTAALDPTERVDLLDGRLRIRQLPDDPEADAEYKVMVVDDTNDPNERGVVKWRSINLNAGCDWIVEDVFPGAPPHVTTVWDGSNCTWDQRHGVGIGIQGPRFKLQVHHDNYEMLARTATHSRVVVDNYNNQFNGIMGVSRPAGQGILFGHAQGVKGEAHDCRVSVGVHGLAHRDVDLGPAGHIVGVQGIAGQLPPFIPAVIAGVYGEAHVAQGWPQAWAGYFNGDVNINGDIFMNGVLAYPSDAQFKTDVQDLDGAMGIISELLPRTYQHNALGRDALGLAEGTVMGFVAQEIEQVLPELVHNAEMPALVDSLGNVVQDALPYKTIHYVGLIPLLTAAIQEQQATITTMQQQLHAMQQQLAACCAAPPSATDQRLAPTGAVIELGLDPRAERMLTIQPNPFTDQTTLRYTLERAGRAQLLVNSGDGRHLRVLSEAQLEAGEYQHVWNTAHLAPGVYYVTLLLDGEPLAKRAVKL